VIWGEGDTALLPGLLEGLQAHVPDLSLHRIAQATHWIVHEQAARVAELIAGFLARSVLSTPARDPAGGS
jgi:pimeloyl-ACP methyl ester carboxylesterase